MRFGFFGCGDSCMGVNVGAIFVQAVRGIDVARVSDEISRYWRSKGAKPDPRSPLDLKPLGVIEKKSKRLGVAIAPAAGGWIGVRDSDRYFADYGLAKYLSKALEVRICWFVLSSAVDSGILQLLNQGRATETFEGQVKVATAIKLLKVPASQLYFDDLSKKMVGGWTLLSLSPVTAAKYDTGPEPEGIDGEADEKEDAGPPPDSKLLAYLTRLEKGFKLTGDDWERVMMLDDNLLPQACRLGQRAIEGKEDRPDVLRLLAQMAIRGKDHVLFKAVLNRAPAAKMHPIDKPGLMMNLGLWLSSRVHKGPIPPDWRPSVKAWIEAALPHAARERDIHAAAAEAYARLGEPGKAQDQIRLAIRRGSFHGTGLDTDPVVAPLLKKNPFAAEIAKLLREQK
jgi:hypothetical protein